jgi:type VI secretion system protein VasG
VESGARNVDNILTNTMLPDISRQLLEAIAEGTKPGAIRVHVDADGGLSYEVTAAARADGFTLGQPAAEGAAPVTTPA